eukprot:1158305-Pelagomonas_calceolata.AAC.2
MDGELKKEQIGTLIVWIGALEGGFWGWWVGQGETPLIIKTQPPSCQLHAAQMQACTSRLEVLNTASSVTKALCSLTSTTENETRDPFAHRALNRNLVEKFLILSTRYNTGAAGSDPGCKRSGEESVAWKSNFRSTNPSSHLSNWPGTPFPPLLHC